MTIPTPAPIPAPTPAPSSVLTVTRDGPVATVTLNRPDKLNALNAALWRDLAGVFRALDRDEGLRCLLLRGAPGMSGAATHLSAGGDISEFTTLRATPEQARAYAHLMVEALAALAAVRHPVVVQAEGHCIGGGTELVVYSDIRIAGASARFGIPINRLGFVMSYPELDGFIARVGRSVALEMLLEGRILSAEEALAKGLVSRIVADDAVADEAARAAARIAEAAPLVNRWHKAFANRLLSPAPLTAAELEEGFACYSTADYQQGIRAFVDKRKPVFEGR